MTKKKSAPPSRDLENGLDPEGGHGDEAAIELDVDNDASRQTERIDPTREDAELELESLDRSPRDGHLDPLAHLWDESWEALEIHGAHVELGPFGAWEVYADPRKAGKLRRLIKRGEALDKEAARADVTKRLPSMGFSARPPTRPGVL